MRPVVHPSRPHFFSSIFWDFDEELDLLVRKVIPALRARVRESFVELVEVDLRFNLTIL